MVREVGPEWAGQKQRGRAGAEPAAENAHGGGIRINASRSQPEKMGKAVRSTHMEDHAAAIDSLSRTHILVPSQPSDTKLGFWLGLQRRGTGPTDHQKVWSK